MRVEVNKSKD